ncbi:MAG: general secretion pathway protein K [Candidatus Azotimanducaceae bacterium]|jgi:general secretion pathway protein K
MNARHQQGVALITILLVVVIATVLGVSMSTDQHFAINRARTFFDQGIVRQYALGGEELARQILHQDFLDAPETDHSGENWAAKDLRFDFEQGEIELLIEDLQSRLNLNSIAVEGDGKRLAKDRLTRLFEEQGLDAAYVDRVLDWVDQNNGVSALGAEDYDYLGLERPYRAANAPMADLSELRLILEMDTEKFSQILPYVAAIGDANTKININTATPQVLQSIAPGLSLSAAESIVAGRDNDGPFQGVEDFTGDPSLGEAAAKNVNPQGLSVQSSFFQVSIRARFQDRFGYLTSIIQRDPTDGTMRVIYRDQGKKVQPFIAEQQDETNNG